MAMDGRIITKYKKILSFIIPVYNAEKYIGVCLDSLLNQDVAKEEYEILCINDGSTDGSLKILQEYAEKYENIVVIDKPNEGVSATRNLGIEKAQGEYIWFVDSDDWIARNCLGYLFDVIKKHNVKVVQLQFDYIKAEWRIEQCKSYTVEKEKLQYELSNVPMRYDSCWSSLIKRELLMQYDIRFFKHISYGEDLMFIRTVFDCIKLGAKQDEDNAMAHCTGDIFYFYRQNDNSAMDTRWTKNREKYAQSLLEMAKIEKERMEKENMPRWYTELYVQRFYSSMYTYMMFWLPGLEAKLQEKLEILRREKLYPCIKRPKDNQQVKKKLGIKQRLLEWYKNFSFSHPWCYKIYYKQMSKKYKNSTSVEK